MQLNNRNAFRALFIAALVGFVFTVIVLFSWNSFAPDLFQLPAMKFKQALGLVLFVGCLSFLLRLGGNHSSKLKHWGQHGGLQQ